MNRAMVIALWVGVAGCGANDAPPAESPPRPSMGTSTRHAPPFRRASIAPDRVPPLSARHDAEWLIPAEGCSNREFGAGVAVEGDRVLVAAPWAGYAPNESGELPRACVYRHGLQGFRLESVLSPSVPALAQGFGRALLLRGPRALVSGQAAVHVFRRATSGWELAHTLEPPARKGAPKDALEFGVSLELYESDALVGVLATRLAGTKRVESGSVHDYPLRAPPSTPARALLGRDDDRSFGSALSVDGERLAVGADARFSSASETGSASVFVRAQSDTWTLSCRVAGSDPGELFGASIALAGNRLVVGAPHANVRGVVRAGRVDVFTLTSRGCARTATLASPSPRVDGRFGTSLDTDGRRLVVGEPALGARDSELAGRVWLYSGDASSVRLERELSSQASRPGDLLGSSVALGPGSVFAGAPREGAGYVIGSRF